jgi:hypothetical protein
MQAIIHNKKGGKVEKSEIYRNYVAGLMSAVHELDLGWGVILYDTDAEMVVSTVKIFQTHGRATKYAKLLVKE